MSKGCAHSDVAERVRVMMWGDGGATEAARARARRSTLLAPDRRQGSTSQTTKGGYEWRAR